MTHLTILTGASRGLGAGLAQLLCTRDAHVLGISRKANADLARHAAHHGAQFEQWPLDLVDAAPVATRLSGWLTGQTSDRLASVTLINNACLIPPMVPMSQSQAADTVQALRVGLEAPMLLTAAFLSATKDWSIPRRVLNISSGLGRRAMASSSAYCAVKAGMDHFTRCVALDEALQANGAKICSLAPGVIDTDMQLQLRQSNPSQFPDVALFQGWHSDSQLASPLDAARKVLDFLERPDFGQNPIGDIRD
jgi:benzil reductase ((S)-benzoin forming)